MEGATSFGQWLREQRKARDLTQEDLAERIGCSLWTIQKIEVGTRHPSKQVADILADYLRIPPEQHEPFLRFARGKGTEWLQASDAHTAGGETYGGTSSSPERIAHPNNLPAQVTSFIGREAEVAQLREWLFSGRTRLLTLTGPGGVGKTRLAMQVAASLLDDLADPPYADGVWFVELAALTDHNLVAFTVASVLNVI